MCSHTGFGPWRVRRFRRLSNKLLRLGLWLWFGGLAAVGLAALFSGNDPWWVLLACVLTVYPALLILVGLPAFEGLWKVLLRAPGLKGSSLAGRLGWLGVATMGVAFLALGLMPLVLAAWHLLGMR
jgi:hypothetical protein